MGSIDPIHRSPGAFLGDDADTVPDCLDRCPGLDDRIDNNQDGRPDCVDALPAVSTWGVVILTLMILSFARTVFRGNTPGRG